MRTAVNGDLAKQVRTPPVRPADGVVGCVYESSVPGGWHRWMEKEILWFCFRRAEPERMISGRTFAREMIALRQRETKRAGWILALQGQNPGQLELRTHSEFGANLSVTPGGFAFLCLRAIPRRSSPAGYHSLRLRPAKTKPQYLLLQPAIPLPRDERLLCTPPHPVRWPYRRRPHLLN